MLRRVGTTVESQSYGRPAIFVLDILCSVVAQDFIDEDLRGVTGVCHAMVADKNDIHNIGQISSCQ